MGKIFKPKIEVLPSGLGNMKKTLLKRKRTDKSGTVARTRREIVKTFRLAEHGV